MCTTVIFFFLLCHLFLTNCLLYPQMQGSGEQQSDDLGIIDEALSRDRCAAPSSKLPAVDIQSPAAQKFIHADTSIDPSSQQAALASPRFASNSSSAGFSAPSSPYTLTRSPTLGIFEGAAKNASADSAAAPAPYSPRGPNQAASYSGSGGRLNRLRRTSSTSALPDADAAARPGGRNASNVGGQGIGFFWSPGGRRGSGATLANGRQMHQRNLSSQLEVRLDFLR